MYDGMIGNGHTHGIGGWKADLHDYARWEYGTEEAARWLLRNAGRHRREKRTSLRTRILGWFRPSQVSATTAVAAVENRGR